MPIYTYKCKECETLFEASHSMNERLTDCKICNTIQSLKRVPAYIATQYKENEIGKIVDSYIDEAKRDVAEEKRRLKEQDWEK